MDNTKQEGKETMKEFIKDCFVVGSYVCFGIGSILLYAAFVAFGAIVTYWTAYFGGRLWHIIF